MRTPPWKDQPGCQIRSDQSVSHVRLFATPWISAHQASLSITNSQSSLRFTSIESVMPSSHLIIWRPLLLPPIPPSIRVFSNESAIRIRWPKYRSFSFNISPSNEHPGLVSFRMDWLDLLAVQGTLKSLWAFIIQWFFNWILLTYDGVLQFFKVISFFLIFILVILE